MSILLHKPYLVKWSTKGGGGQKCSKIWKKNTELIKPNTAIVGKKGPKVVEPKDRTHECDRCEKKFKN